MDIWIATQHNQFPDAIIGTCARQNSDLYMGPQSDPEEAELAAKCMIGLLDRYRVHHQEKNIRNVPRGYDVVPTHGRSIRKDEDNRDHITNTDGQSIRTIYEEQTDWRDVYEPPFEQLIWLQQGFQTCRVGMFCVKLKGQRPFLWPVPLVEDSWGFPGLAGDKFEECLALMKQSRVYQEPELVKPEIDEEVMKLCGMKKQKPQQIPQHNGKQNGHQPKGANGRLSGRRNNGANG